MVGAYSQKIFNGQKPVFDGRKNLYCRDPLPSVGADKVGVDGIHSMVFDMVGLTRRWSSK